MVRAVDKADAFQRSIISEAILPFNKPIYLRFDMILGAGFCGANTLHKTVSTTFFLYFACILPAIAFGVLNYNNTGGQIGL